MKPTGNLIVDGMVQIVTAHLGQNPIDASRVPDLMKQVSATLVECVRDASTAMEAAELPSRTITQFPAIAAPTVTAPAAASAVAAPAAAKTPGRRGRRPAAATAPELTVAETVVEEPAPEPEIDPRRKDLPTVPAVPINKSVHKDAIICLFDGERRKMLHRHIWTKYGMKPQEYRDYWNLPDDYPMTAPGYSDEKRMVAVTQGLGSFRKKKKKAAKAAAPSKAAAPKRAKKSA